MVKDQATSLQDEAAGAADHQVKAAAHQVDQHQVDLHQVDRHQVHTEIQLQHHHQIDRIVLDNKQQLNNVLKPIDKKLIEQINLQKLEN